MLERFLNYVKEAFQFYFKHEVLTSGPKKHKCCGKCHKDQE